MIKTVHVFDADGTLIDSSHRYRIDPATGKIDLDHWIENCTPEKIAQDTLLPHAALYKALLDDPTAYVVIATARVMQRPDFIYFREVLGWPDKLVSRKKGDTSKGADMKIRGLRYLNNLAQFANAVKYFYEDNKDYLYPVADCLKAQAIFVPSEQGY